MSYVMPPLIQQYAIAMQYLLQYSPACPCSDRNGWGGFEFGKSCWRRDLNPGPEA